MQGKQGEAVVRLFAHFFIFFSSEEEEGLLRASVARKVVQGKRCL